MRKYLILFCIFQLQSCVLRAGASVHDTSLDDQFAIDSLICTVSVTEDMGTNFEIYGQHKSICFDNESNKWESETGLNELGVNFKYKL